MAKQYRIPPGTVYPATVAGYRKAKAGKMNEVDWIEPNEEEIVIPAPYSEIVSSWLENGIEEIGKEEPIIQEVVKKSRKEDKEVNEEVKQ